MSEVSRYLFLAGALPFIVFGALHALLTPHTPSQSKALSPRDPAVRRAMASDTLFLSRRVTVWLGWVGFNLSHGLGAVVFGAAVLLVGRSQGSFQRQATVFLPFAVVVSMLYLVLALRYWFRIPIAGIATSLACFVISWILFVTA